MVKVKERILNAEKKKKKQRVTGKGTPIRLPGDFFSKNFAGQKGVT